MYMEKTVWKVDVDTGEMVALDTETTSIDAQQASLVGLSFSVTAGNAAYLPLGHSYTGVPAQLPFKDTLEKLKPLLEDPAICKTGQNLKYDIEVLQKHFGGTTVRKLRKAFERRDEQSATG